MILTDAVSTSNQRDRVRLRCHGQSCLYYQQIEEEEGPSRRVFPSRKRTLHLPRTLYSGYRSARVGQPVILVLTLISFSLSISVSPSSCLWTGSRRGTTTIGAKEEEARPSLDHRRRRSCEQLYSLQASDRCTR